MNNNLVSNVPDPVSENDAVNNKYVDRKVGPHTYFHRKARSMLVNFLDKIVDIKNVDSDKVVFHEEQGKLKASNIKINDILIKDENAAEGVIPIYENGKFKPSGWPFITVFASMVERVNKRGDDMTGPLDMSNDLISGIKTPESDQDAVDKKYVDDESK